MKTVEGGHRVEDTTQLDPVNRVPLLHWHVLLLLSVLNPATQLADAANQNTLLHNFPDGLSTKWNACDNLWLEQMPKLLKLYLWLSFVDRNALTRTARQSSKRYSGTITNFIACVLSYLYQAACWMWHLRRKRLCSRALILHKIDNKVKKKRRTNRCTENCPGKPFQQKQCQNIGH